MPAPAFRGRSGVLTLALLIAVALGVRLWHLEQKNVWLDEASAWNTARRPAADVVKTTAGDVHPPLYYFVLKGWMAVAGDSPAALRGLSVVVGVMAVFLAALLASRWLPHGAAVSVVAWLAVSPHMVWHAQEMRMYALVTMLVMGSCLAFSQWIDSAGTRHAALATFVATAAAALWTHYFAVLVIAAMWIYLVLATRCGGLPARRVWGRWLAAQGAIALLYLPWLPTAIAQMTKGQSWRQPVAVVELPGYAALFVKETLAGSHYGLSPALGAASLALVFVAGAGWLFLILRQLASRRVDAGTLIALLCIVPLATALLLLPLSGQMQLSRYLAYVTPLVAIGAAAGWSGSVPRQSMAVGALAVAAVASAIWVAAYFRDTEKDIDLRPAAAVVFREWRAAESNGSTQGIVASISGTSIPLRYLLRDSPNLAVLDLWHTAPLSRVADTVLDASQGAPAWVVIDPRWPGFKTFDPGTDPRFTEIDIPDRGRTRARLFRVKR
jgi:uncharacterized membrane protein